MTSKTKRRPTFADTIRQAVRTSGETVTAVARGAGMPQSTLSRFMRDMRDLTLGRAQRLADYLGLQLQPGEQGRSRR